MISDLFVICVHAASDDSQVVGLVLNEGYAVTDDSLATDFDFSDALNISRKETTRWNRIMRALGLLQLMHLMGIRPESCLLAVLDRNLFLCFHLQAVPAKVVKGECIQHLLDLGHVRRVLLHFKVFVWLDGLGLK
jgi:hypothetical protein